tara:strand:+ start:372 stop:587 length:216 start_codon:yes stop_codon:yes gene_type:complete
MTKDEIIKDLSEKLEMEQQVKKHEVLINASYKETITKLEDQVRCIVQVNERLFVEKAHLKEKIKYLLFNEK